MDINLLVAANLPLPARRASDLTDTGPDLVPRRRASSQARTALAVAGAALVILVSAWVGLPVAFA